MRVSLRHVAEHAGVSRVTASNVLRGRASEVSPATRERVLEAVRQLEYIPVTPPSRQGTHTPTRIIGLFYDGVELDEYWGLITARGLHEGAIEHDYDLLTMLRARPQQAMRINALDDDELRFLDRRSDGFIFITPVGRAGVLRALVRHGIPVVTAYTDEKVPGVSSVVLDNEGAMHLAVEHLLKHGHRKIGFVYGLARRSDFQARRAGYMAAMSKAGLTPLCFEFEQPGWKDEVLDAVQRGELTGLVCASDYFTVHLLDAATARGMAVPRDLSIVGMDDIPEAERLGLTTVKYSTADVGLHSVEVIVRRLADDNDVTGVVLPVELIERSTVAVI